MHRDKWGRPIEPPVGYGGNAIPDSYLDRFNAATDAWLVRIGARQPNDTATAQLPMQLRDFVKEL